MWAKGQLLIECHLTNTEEMIEIEKSLSGQCYSNTFYRQESSLDTKIIDQKDNRKQNICILSKYLPTRYLITNGKIQWRTPQTPP